MLYDPVCALMTFDPWVVRRLPSKEEERKERARRRRAERSAQMLADEAWAYRKQSMPDQSYEARRERLDREGRKELDTILAALSGRKFRAWYEATTGESVEGFLANVLLTPEQFEERYPRLSWHRDYRVWLESRIERVANDNPWKNPEMLEHWAKQLHDCKDPKERRRILLRLATPPWVDSRKIREIYAARVQIEIETGVPHDVDHIVPLVSRKVCGLHCEANLRIVPATENRSKSNKFDVLRDLFT